MTTTTEQSLKERWTQFKLENPKVRIRDAAKKLGVSEVELLATDTGNGVTRLEGDFIEMYKELPSLGYVMSLTRNEACVLEHKGHFEAISISGGGAHKMGTLIGSIEARVFFSAWKYAFATETPANNGFMKNIQFFDGSGAAITKVYLLGEEQAAAYDQFVRKYKAADQYQSVVVTPDTLPSFAAQIDEEAFRSDWKALKDTHEFFGLLRRYNVNRLHALEIAGDAYTKKIRKEQLTPLLETAAATQLAIMIFAGNKGNLQIHQNVIKKVYVMDKWLNILDPEFNMHLNMDEIAHTWIVKKPTSDGEVTSIECFNAARELVVQFFGLRKPGQPELEEWKALLQAL